MNLTKGPLKPISHSNHVTLTEGKAPAALPVSQQNKSDGFDNSSN